MLNKPAVQKTLSVAVALLVWQGAAAWINTDILVASPVTVIARLFEMIAEADFWGTVAFSLVRIVCGFLLAFVLGIALALAAGRYRAVEMLLWPFVITVKSVPVASFIILSLMWMRGEDLSVFISFLMVFPMIYSNVLQGIKSTDGKLIQMAQLYRVGWGRRLLYIYVPAVRPYLVSACSVALGTAWKAGVAAEVIGIVTGSIGEKLYDSKIYLETADLFAWTVVIILISVAFEKLFLALLNRAFAGSEKI